MKKITLAELERIFWNYNVAHHYGENYNERITGVIVFKPSNWEDEYTETERSYRVHSCNRRFQSGKIANSFYGDCLDGKDLGVRLDWYNWEPEYCYLDDDNNYQYLD